MKKVRLIFIVIILFSCSNGSKTPNYVIPHEEMVNIIIDMHLTDGILTINKLRNNLIKNDTSNYFDVIFNNYGYTRADFDTSIYFYSTNINRYDKIYEDVLNQLNEMETKLKEERAEEHIKDSIENIKEGKILKNEKVGKKSKDSTAIIKDWKSLKRSKN